jgi:hypothetical protein
MSRRGLAALEARRRKGKRRSVLRTMILLGGVAAGVRWGVPAVEPEGWPKWLHAWGAVGLRDSTEAVGANLPIPIPTLGQRVRVEVLNAGGVSGMAAEARDRLRDAGFDVVYYGNAPQFGETASVVFHRAGDREAAEAVARSLGISEVETRLDPSLLLEVTVRLGASWVEERDQPGGTIDSEEGPLHPEEGG